MTNLILIGFRGVGKTVLGEVVAREVEATFIDTDHLLEKKYRCSIPAIFAKVGEEFFRRLEREVIEELACQGSVVAIGGGAVEEPANGEALRKLGKIVWLDAAPSTLVSRLEGGNRPRLSDLSLADEVKDRYGFRRPLYEAWAQAVVSTEQPMNGVVDELKRIWRAL